MVLRFAERLGHAWPRAPTSYRLLHMQQASEGPWHRSRMADLSTDGPKLQYQKLCAVFVAFIFLAQDVSFKGYEWDFEGH